MKLDLRNDFIGKAGGHALRRTLHVPLAALHSPGENTPDPPHQSTQTGLGAGVREGIVALFPVHVAAAVMQGTSQSLSWLECRTFLAFRRLND